MNNKRQLEYYYRHREVVLKKARLKRLLKKLENKIGNMKEARSRYAKLKKELKLLQSK